MGQRIAVMNDGLIQQVDTPLNLYRHPSNMFVAGFIGSPPMNFVEARLQPVNGSVVVEAAGMRLALAEQQAQQVKSHFDKQVVFGVRPQDIYDRALSPITPTEGNTARLQVDVIEPMGAEYMLTLLAGADLLVATVDADTKAEEGAPLDLVFEV